jgi:N-acetylmuramoyl-L-alanine amidase
MSAFQPILLTGDYVGSHVRQQQALDEQCLCVLEFHFNSAVAAARGGEVHYQPAVPASRELAEAVWAELAAIGLPPHGSQPVKSTAESPRSAWIDFYQMMAVVLEPLFISNQSQADWLHDSTNAGFLADAIVAAVTGFFQSKGISAGPIGLSAGHAGKSTPDSGAPCVNGDTEADHTVALRDMVAARL